MPLEEQNRSPWNRDQIQEGLGLVERASRLGRIGPYQLQTAITAVHAEAQTAGQPDWKEIAALYGKLARVHPSVIVALNHAAGAAILSHLGRSQQGAEAYRRAIGLTGNAVERRYLRWRLTALETIS